MTKVPKGQGLGERACSASFYSVGGWFCFTCSTSLAVFSAIRKATIISSSHTRLHMTIKKNTSGAIIRDVIIPPTSLLESPTPRINNAHSPAKTIAKMKRTLIIRVVTNSLKLKSKMTFRMFLFMCFYLVILLFVRRPRNKSIPPSVPPVASVMIGSHSLYLIAMWTGSPDGTGNGGMKEVAQTYQGICG